jgi:predicted phosphohydrolase
MDIFDAGWQGHPDGLYANWRRIVKEEDLVLVPGDISWGMKLPEALPDLEELNTLPGFKVLTKGNHDYWWPGKKRDFVLPGLKRMRFLHGRTFRLGPLGMAVTRGWKLPGDSWFTDADEKIYAKELRFLEQALAAMSDATIRLCVLHYPPFNDRMESGEFAQLLTKYQIQHVVYGHIHGPHPLGKVPQGIIDGIQYHLASCDIIGFQPIPIVEVETSLDFSRGTARFIVDP